MDRLLKMTGDTGTRVKPYTSYLLQAEMISRSAHYPTDGVIAMWSVTTISRRMKLETSIALSVGQEGWLGTSDWDVVFENADIPSGVKVGDIVEIRVKVKGDGRDVHARPLFRRVDKAYANSTSAVSAVLSSFGCVNRDNETRRRAVLMWCDSLKQHLFRLALSKRAARKLCWT